MQYLCVSLTVLFFFFKQKPAYEMRISDWSSDVCSSDLAYAGTGIGLALCRKVVEFHGGTIEVEPSDGPGTVIHVTLPVERDPDPAVPVAVARGAEPPTSGSSPAVGSSGHTEEA